MNNEEGWEIPTKRETVVERQVGMQTPTNESYIKIVGRTNAIELSGREINGYSSAIIGDINPEEKPDWGSMLDTSGPDPDERWRLDQAAEEIKTFQNRKGETIALEVACKSCCLIKAKHLVNDEGMCVDCK